MGRPVLIYPPQADLVMCRACSAAWKCKSSTQPDGSTAPPASPGAAATSPGLPCRECVRSRISGMRPARYSLTTASDRPGHRRKHAFAGCSLLSVQGDAPWRQRHASVVYRPPATLYAAAAAPAAPRDQVWWRPFGLSSSPARECHFCPTAQARARMRLAAVTLTTGTLV